MAVSLSQGIVLISFEFEFFPYLLLNRFLRIWPSKLGTILLSQGLLCQVPESIGNCFVCNCQVNELP